MTETRPPSKETPAGHAAANALDQILLLICAGVSRDAMAKAAGQGKLGPIGPETLDAAIAEARRRLTLAVDYNRDEEIGKAITRLNDLFARALRVQDVKTALAAEKERIKLQNLDAAGRRAELLDARGPAEETDADAEAQKRPRDEAAAEIFDAIDQHLEPRLQPNDHATYADRIREAAAILAAAARGRTKPAAKPAKSSARKPRKTAPRKAARKPRTKPAAAPAKSSAKPAKPRKAAE